MRMRLLVLGLCCASFAARAADAPATGKITGRVIIAGLAPKLPTLPVTKDNKICGVNKPDEALVIGTGGGIRNAVLWLSDVPAPKGGAAEKYRLEAQTCRYEPHVVIARAGATLEVVDGDPVLHHPHAEVGEEKQWSFPMPIKGYAVPRPLPKAEVVRIGCEAHPWMRAWVVVIDSGVTGLSDELGAFTLSGVPPGKHKLKLWHERLGEREEDVEVAAGETLQKDVTLSPK